jgi:phosphatidylinositol glycan class B
MQNMNAGRKNRSGTSTQNEGSNNGQERFSPPALPRLPAFGCALYLLAFRLSNAYLIRTYFAPDEFWQCTEIAHRLVYGLGYVTWEWIEHIRGTTHPLLFTALFWVLDALKVDSPSNLVSILPA